MRPAIGIGMKHVYEIRPRKDKRGARIVFDCRMTNDPAMINKEKDK
jgi:hypothetical protein